MTPLPRIQNKTIVCNDPASLLELKEFYDKEAGQRFLNTQFPLVQESTLDGGKTRFCENTCPCEIKFPFPKLEGWRNDPTTQP